jgi:hypothetical protein
MYGEQMVWMLKTGVLAPLVKSIPSDYIWIVRERVPKRSNRDRKECKMDTWGKEKFGSKEPVEFRCDSRRCWKCSGDVCEERFGDLVYGVGP